MSRQTPDRTVARNRPLAKPGDVQNAQAHNERNKDIYTNPDILPEYSPLNVHFKVPTDDYEKMFDRMVEDKTISTRGLKPDATKFGELIFDVNSAYFYNHGGYEFAKQFYADAYKAAVEIVGGEEYILSAVMHADERNRAMSEALGEDVFHYHMHVVYIPVVEKEILWSKRCKDKALIGTVKEKIMQVSNSKKWQSRPKFNENGNPILRKNGKPDIVKSYSVLQDDFFQKMRDAGYTDIERGERGSTEEHLTVTQFKVQKEQERYDDLEEKIEKREQEYQRLTEKTKVARTQARSIAEIQAIGKRTVFGKIEMTPEEAQELKSKAIYGLSATAKIHDLQEKLKSALHDGQIWKKRYEKAATELEQLKVQVKDYLAALAKAPERVRAFIERVLTERAPERYREYQRQRPER